MGDDQYPFGFAVTTKNGESPRPGSVIVKVKHAGDIVGAPGSTCVGRFVERVLLCACDV